jgi:hypothetical protein
MVPALTQVATNLGEVGRVQGAVLAGALRDQRESLKRCLMAAAVIPENAEELLWKAIDAVPGAAWCRSADPGRLLVRSLDAVLTREAAIVKQPYRLLLTALGRRWQSIQSLLAEAELFGARGERVILNVCQSFIGWEARPGQALDGLLIERVDWVCAERARIAQQSYQGLGGTRPNREPDRVLMMLESVTSAREWKGGIRRFFIELERLIGDLDRCLR